MAGVVVLSNYQAYDADTFATRHDVPVYLLNWLTRSADRIESPIQFITDEIGSSMFEVRHYALLSGSDDAIVYRDSDATV